MEKSQTLNRRQFQIFSLSFNKFKYSRLVLFFTFKNIIFTFSSFEKIAKSYFNVIKTQKFCHKFYQLLGFIHLISNIYVEKIFDSFKHNRFKIKVN